MEHLLVVRFTLFYPSTSHTVQFIINTLKFTVLWESSIQQSKARIILIHLICETLNRWHISRFSTKSLCWPFFSCFRWTQTNNRWFYVCETRRLCRCCCSRTTVIKLVEKKRVSLRRVFFFILLIKLQSFMVLFLARPRRSVRSFRLLARGDFWNIILRARPRAGRHGMIYWTQIQLKIMQIWGSFLCCVWIWIDIKKISTKKKNLKRLQRRNVPRWEKKSWNHVTYQVAAD